MNLYNDETVRALPAPSKRTELPTAIPSLRVRIEPSGKRRYVTYYTRLGNGKRAMLCLGDAFKTTFTEAQAKLEKVKAVRHTAMMP